MYKHTVCVCVTTKLDNNNRETLSQAETCTRTLTGTRPCEETEFSRLPDKNNQHLPEMWPEAQSEHTHLSNWALSYGRISLEILCLIKSRTHFLNSYCSCRCNCPETGLIIGLWLKTGVTGKTVTQAYRRHTNQNSTAVVPHCYSLINIQLYTGRSKNTNV